MPPRKKQPKRVEAPVTPAAPDVEPSEPIEAAPQQPLVPPTAQAYAAARAALAAQMVGPMYGQMSDADVEPLVHIADPVPLAPIPTLAAAPPPPPPTARSEPVVTAAATSAPETVTATPPAPIARVTVVSPATLDEAETETAPQDKPKHRRPLVIAAALLVVGALALSTELIPFVTRTQPTNPPVAGANPSPDGSAIGSAGSWTSVSPSVDATAVASSDTTADPTAATTTTTTAKPTPRPTPKPTRRPTAKPTPYMTAVWVSYGSTSNKWTWIVRTKPGADCSLTRLRLAPAPTGTPRTATNHGVAGDDGLALIEWSQSGRQTYRYQATCTVPGHSASTTWVTIKT